MVEYEAKGVWLVMIAFMLLMSKGINVMADPYEDCYKKCSAHCTGRLISICLGLCHTICLNPPTRLSSADSILSSTNPPHLHN